MRREKREERGRGREGEGGREREEEREREGGGREKGGREGERRLTIELDAKRWWTQYTTMHTRRCCACVLMAESRAMIS
jgi:hypothetical protein